jgi:hypothetical protein
MQHGGPLMQCLANQADISLRQVTHATVQQLGGTRGRALGKVMGLQQHDRQAPRSSIKRHAQPARTATHHRQVMEPVLIQPGQQGVATGQERRRGHHHNGG